MKNHLLTILITALVISSGWGIAVANLAGQVHGLEAKALILSRVACAAPSTLKRTLDQFDVGDLPNSKLWEGNPELWEEAKRQLVIECKQ